jgi:hypothetical protein
MTDVNFRGEKTNAPKVAWLLSLDFGRILLRISGTRFLADAC